MTDRDPVKVTNLDRYGSAEIPWSRPRDLLRGGSPTPDIAFFLGTSRPDGRPHAAGIGALWLDGDIYFTSGPETRKARNLAANPACTISCRLEGIDLILECEATRVTISRHWRRRRGCTAKVAGLRRCRAMRSRRRTAPRAPGRHPGSSTVSDFTRASASPPRSRTEQPAGGSTADGQAVSVVSR